MDIQAIPPKSKNENEQNLQTNINKENGAALRRDANAYVQEVAVQGVSVVVVVAAEAELNTQLFFP